MQTQKVIDHIVSWLKDYATNAKVNGYVIGVSGGVDSGVVSTLAAMTGMKTLLIGMPIRQKADQVDRAQDHMNDLKSRFPNVETISVNLTPAFEEIYKTFHVNDEVYPNENLTFANTRARLRMLTLYYYGQLNGLLVCGTGNKVEDFGIGFYTKYGDGGVDISPIADLVKTQVYEVARHLDIVESIQKAIPTDGLWDEERTDEQQMGASYPELEWAMSVYNTHKADDFSGREKEVFQIYDRLHRATLHKINPIPVCEIPETLLN